MTPYWLFIFIRVFLTFLKKNSQKNRERKPESERFVQSAIFVVVVIRARKMLILSKLRGFD